MAFVTLPRNDLFALECTTPDPETGAAITNQEPKQPYANSSASQSGPKCKHYRLPHHAKPDKMNLAHKSAEGLGKSSLATYPARAGHVPRKRFAIGVRGNSIHEVTGSESGNDSIASRSGTKCGCLYCSTVPPLRASRRFWNSNHDPAGKRMVRTGPSLRVLRLLEYSTFWLQSR